MYRSVLRGWPLAGLALLAACAESAPVGPTGSPSFNHTGDPPPFTTLGHWTLCKEGTAASFEVTVNSGTPTIETFADGECRDVGLTPVGGGRVTVTATEIVDPATMVLDHIEFDSLLITGSAGSRTINGTNTITYQIHGDLGIKVTFHNRPVEPPPPPGGGQGCTPGYWKQTHHFDSWPAPYTPGTQFSAVFENAFPGKTLVQVAALGGGGLNALGRHTVASLLNGASSGVNANLSAQQVIDAFNAVFPGGDYEGQKNIFAAFNEQGCPLN
jgi:hypothetical protein